MRLGRRLFAISLLAGCASTPEAPAPAAAPPDTMLAVRAMAASAPARPRHIISSVQARFGDARFNGRSVVRVAPPYRARSDLFGPRGEGLLSAVLIGDELTLPPNAPPNAPTASPPLQWAMLGVFRPPRGATLIATAGDSLRGELTYAAGEERWRYTLDGGRVSRIAHDRPGRGREQVEVEYRDGSALPVRAVYRDLPNFLELIATVDEVRDVEAFPPAVWVLDGR